MTVRGVGWLTVKGGEYQQKEEVLGFNLVIKFCRIEGGGVDV